MPEQTKRSDDSDTVRPGSDADTVLTEMSVARHHLEKLRDDADVSEMTDVELVDIRSTLKDLEDIVEDVRKKVIESELDTRIEPGERLHGLNRIETTRKTVETDPKTVVARAIANEVDISQFVDISASKLHDTAPETAEFGEYSYTYYR